MNDEPEVEVEGGSIAALFRGNPQQPSKIHPEHLFSDFPAFRAATDGMECWPDLLLGSASRSARIVLMTHISLVTLYQFADSVTRQTAVFDDLVKTAQQDRSALECLRQLVIEDLRRPGAPNATLRAWAASYLDDQITIPSKKEGIRPHMVARGVFLATLIAHTEREGFRPTRNKGAKGEARSSGCEIVQAALREEDWQHVPTVATLEGVWREFQHFVARSVEKKKKRSVLELGVHPESMIAMMARYPSEKFA